MNKWKLFLLLYCGLVLYVQHESDDLPGDGVAVSDKALHMLEYACRILAWGALVERSRFSLGFVDLLRVFWYWG